ncbi:unnamed protein product, partial [Amoebophrya sp. A120]
RPRVRKACFRPPPLPERVDISGIRAADVDCGPLWRFLRALGGARMAGPRSGDKTRAPAPFVRGEGEQRAGVPSQRTGGRGRGVESKDPPIQRVALLFCFSFPRRFVLVIDGLSGRPPRPALVPCLDAGAWRHWAACRRSR